MGMESPETAAKADDSYRARLVVVGFAVTPMSSLPSTTGNSVPACEPSSRGGRVQVEWDGDRYGGEDCRGSWR